jgi:hypothetical protein
MQLRERDGNLPQGSPSTAHPGSFRSLVLHPVDARKTKGRIATPRARKIFREPDYKYATRLWQAGEAPNDNAALL